MGKIRDCKSFFAFLNGKEVEPSDNNQHFDSSYSFWLPVQSLYNSVNTFKWKNNPVDEDRKRYRSLTEIKLKSY